MISNIIYVIIFLDRSVRLIGGERRLRRHDIILHPLIRSIKAASTRKLH